MPRTPASLLALALAAVPAAAQIAPRNFAPTDYTTEFHADMAAIVDSGVWDLVERSPARMLLVAFRKQFGFDLADLDDVRLLQRVDPPAEGAQPWQNHREQVWILEGSEKVGMAGLSEEVQDEYSIAETIGGVSYRRSEYFGREMATPVTGALVIGYTLDNIPRPEPRDPGPGLVAQTLAGERKGGTPVPDLMPLTASPRALLVIAAVPSEGMPLSPENLQPFPPSWFVADDLPVGFRAQIVRAPGDDERLVIEVLVRFASSAGARTMADGFAADRAKWADTPELKPIAVALEPFETRIDGRDLIASLDLGTERELGARLSPLLFAMLTLAFDASPEPVPLAEVGAEPAPRAGGEPDKKKL